MQWRGKGRQQNAALVAPMWTVRNTSGCGEKTPRTIFHVLLDEITGDYENSLIALL
jgi:hypothetical protein